MAEKPAPEDIVAAVNASGYLMEQEVASSFEQLGYHVRTNRPFSDPDEGKSREIDVTAVKLIHRDDEKRLAIYLEFVVECKNTNLPFVFLTRPKNEVDRRSTPREIVFPIDEYRTLRRLDNNKVTFDHSKPFFELDLAAAHHHMSSDVKAVQFCRIERKGNGWAASHSGLFDSIFMPIIKGFEARRSEVPKYRQDDDWIYVWMFVPTVVIRGDIFTIDSQAAKPEPVASPHVTFTRDIKDKTYEGRYAIEFVDEDHLKDFVQRIEPFGKLLTDRILGNFERFKQRTRNQEPVKLVGA